MPDPEDWPDPCARCHRYRLVESVTGIWRCVDCEPELCRERWQRTLKWLRQRQRIMGGRQ